MHIGVISDSHGMKHSMKKAVEMIKETENVERWLHAGDFGRDAEYLRELTGQKVDCVAGNCDGMFTNIATDFYLDIYGKKIWLTHGHKQSVKNSLRQIIKDGHKNSIDIIVYGHTHNADITWDLNMLIFNPGSTYECGYNKESCGILTIEESGQIGVRIITMG